jgi:hypothetical protein
MEKDMMVAQQALPPLCMADREFYWEYTYPPVLIPLTTTSLLAFLPPCPLITLSLLWHRSRLPTLSSGVLLLLLPLLLPLWSLLFLRAPNALVHLLSRRCHQGRPWLPPRPCRPLTLDRRIPTTQYLTSSTSSGLAGSLTVSTLSPTPSQLRGIRMADSRGSTSSLRSTHPWSKGCVPFFLLDSWLPMVNGYSLCSSWRSLLVTRAPSPKSSGMLARSIAEPVKGAPGHINDVCPPCPYPCAYHVTGALCPVHVYSGTFTRGCATEKGG